jgi:hypothetical protein
VNDIQSVNEYHSLNKIYLLEGASMIKGASTNESGSVNEGSFIEYNSANKGYSSAKVCSFAESGSLCRVDNPVNPVDAKLKITGRVSTMENETYFMFDREFTEMEIISAAEEVFAQYDGLDFEYESERRM